MILQLRDLDMASCLGCFKPLPGSSKPKKFTLCIQCKEKGEDVRRQEYLDKARLFLLDTGEYTQKEVKDMRDRGFL